MGGGRQRRCAFWFSVTLTLTVLFSHWEITAALDNGLGQRPGMGWNWDYCTNCTPGVSAKARSPLSGEVFVRHIARFLNASGLQSKGYHYVNTDSFWGLPNRSLTGDLQPDPVLWPSGMKSTVEELHAMGLGFGLYGDRGIHECNGKRPGNLGHEIQDAEFFARMGIDWFKQDSCWVPHASDPEIQALREYSKMSAALLDATSKPGRHSIWFALCGWQPWYASPNPAAGYLGGRSIANSWRTGPDTGSGWQAIMQNVENALSLTDNVTGPTSDGGGWNDLCLLLNPGMGHGESVMTFERTRSQFSLYCVMGSNLFMTGNLSRLDPIVLETWGNERAIAINQDPLGLSHRVLPIENSSSGAADAGTSSADDADPRAVSVMECGGEPSRQAWTWSANGLVHNPSSTKCLNVKACQTAVIIDECLPQGPACDTIPGAPAANEVFEPPQHTSGGSIGQIQIKLANRTDCLTAEADDSILVGPCIDADDDEHIVEAAQQRWKFDATTNHITRALDGSCLTAPAAAPSPSPSPTFTQGELMLGRPLQGGKWAIVMLNNAAQQATITCGEACFAAMNFSKPPLGAHISDVWGGELGVVNGSSISLLVPPRGGSRLIVVG
eukprot:COSAG02_NODE_1540_length_12016_cov_20.828480_4_plen_612_part_00